VDPVKLSRYKDRKKGREYPVWIFRLTAEDRRKLQNPASEYVLEDIDSNGVLFWRPVSSSSIAVSLGIRAGKPHSSTSFRLYVSPEDRGRFKRLCRVRGTTMCRVLSNFVEACLVKEDSVLDPSGVVFQSVFLGRPRGPSELMFRARKLQVSNNSNSKVQLKVLSGLDDIESKWVSQ